MKLVALALLVVTASPAMCQQPDWYSIRSFNFPTMYVRHANFVAGIEAITSEQVRDDATFRERPGLSGQCTSYEAVNAPGYYLKVSNLRLTLARNDGSDAFPRDATFCVQPGLAGSGMSLVSASYPDRYLRHRNYEMWLDRFENTNQFNHDATFFRVEPVRF